MTDSIYQYVLAQLQDAKGHWSTVAEESGVPKRTIEKIASGEIDDPGVRKIEKLAAYFRQRESLQNTSQASAALSVR